MKRLALLLVMIPQLAHAGGMFLPGRGVRPFARGGAFTAGADDLNALGYNPAGLVDMIGSGKWHLLLDVGVVAENVDYTRIDSGGVTQPAVHNNGSPQPVPTVGLAYQWSDDLVIAGGVFAPYTALPSYPMNGPQRYSVVNLDGTAIATAELAAGYRLNEHWRIGGGVQFVILDFSSIVVFSGCPGNTICTPEDRQFDAPAQIRDQTVVPSANFGVQGVWDGFRLGASAQLPVWVSSDANIRVPALPSSPYFDQATLVGNSATLEFTLPPVIRLGAELRPTNTLRIEGEVDYEFWSMHDSIKITPQGMKIMNPPGLDSYDMGQMVVQRNFDDTFSLHLGTEWAAADWITLRGGYTYEPSAVPAAYETVLTPDGDKHILAAGLGLWAGSFRIDAMYAHVMQSSLDVTTSKSYALNPIRPPSMTPVGNGHYDVSYDIAGVGVATSF